MPRARDEFTDGEFIDEKAITEAILEWAGQVEDGRYVGTEEYRAYEAFKSWCMEKYHDFYKFVPNDEADRILFIRFNRVQQNSSKYKKLISEVDRLGETKDDSDTENGEEDGEDEEEEQEDNGGGEMGRYGKLNELGVIDSNHTVNYAKLRGIIVHFGKDVDSIVGTEEEPNMQEVKEAWNRWMLNKFDTKWTKFIQEQMERGKLLELVETTYNKNDSFSDNVHQKWEVDKSELEGNGDDDETETGSGESSSKWDQYEEESKKQSETETYSKSEGLSSSGGNSKQDNPGGINDWAEKEGTAESAREDYVRAGTEGSQRSLADEADDEGVSDTGGSVSPDNGPDDGSADDGIGRWAKEHGTTDELDRKKRSTDKEGEGDSDSDGNSGSVADGPDDRADSPSDVDEEPGLDSLDGWGEKYGTTDKVDRPEAPNTKNEKDSSHGGSRGKVRNRKTGRDSPDTSGRAEGGTGRLREIKWPDVDPIDEFDRNKIYEGNTFEWALKLPANSVDTMVTSPPYYNLRDYDIEDAFPISGDWTCEHDWEDNFCTKCGAFLGQLGAEPDPAIFIDHLVDLFERYKRVLKPSGSLWLNIGDTYAGKNIDGRVKAKRKSRIMVPERVYSRLVQNGWVLRDYVIWAKKVWMPDDNLRGNGKPFAGETRLADQWEPLVRFTPESDSYTDLNSNRLLPPSFSGDMGTKGTDGKFRQGEDTQRGRTYHPMGTNPSDVWLVNSDNYQGDHRAVFPEELPKRCIKLTCPDRVCENCGRPYDKEVHVEDEDTVSPGGDYATYEPRCNCNADHKPGVAFDPFLGSGTTAVAAANNGFDWAGVELSEKYQELARERIPTGRQIGLDQW